MLVHLFLDDKMNGMFVVTPRVGVEQAGNMDQKLPNNILGRRSNNDAYR